MASRGAEKRCGLLLGDCQSVERKGKGSSMQHGEGGMGGLRAVNTLLPFELGREIFRSSGQPSGRTESEAELSRRSMTCATG